MRTTKNSELDICRIYLIFLVCILIKNVICWIHFFSPWYRLQFCPFLFNFYKLDELSSENIKILIYTAKTNKVRLIFTCVTHKIHEISKVSWTKSTTILIFAINSKMINKINYGFYRIVLYFPRYLPKNPNLKVKWVLWINFFNSIHLYFPFYLTITKVWSIWYNDVKRLLEYWK